MTRFGSVLQTQWDWRAAGNFMFGGTGGALILMIGLTHSSQMPAILVSLSALALLGLGLGCVWLEIGRPWRFINVAFHPQTSWMTREALVAMLLFACALAAIALQQITLLAIAGLLGLLFLYCQGRILLASKGIPAWRESAVAPLIMTTGLAEGTAICGTLLVAVNAGTSWTAELLAVLLVVRGWAWVNYNKALVATGAPKAALHALAAINKTFISVGTLLPLALSAIYLFTGESIALVAAAIPAVLSGWQMKFTIITRAAQVQGYSMGKLKRGRPVMKPPVRRAGDPWRN